MAQKNNVRKLILRGVLCSLALPVIVSVLTSKASLQNTNTANTIKAANANTAPRRTPPRNTTNRPVNAAVRPSNVNSDDYYRPESTPTPPAKSTVRGRVFYADTGRAVKRTTIMLLKEDGSGGPDSSSSGLTDGEGNFQVKNLQAGTYYAMVNAPGVVSPLAYADFSKKGDKEVLKDAFEGFEKIVVDGVTDVDVQVPARRGGAIGGRVMYDDGDAAIGVKIEILRKVDGRFVGVIPNFSAIMSMMSGGSVFQTDDRGVYRFAGLPPGDYIVKVTENTMTSEERTYYDPFEATLGGNSFLTVFYPDVLDTKAAQLISVQLGQEISEINLVIPSRNLYKLEGKIINLKDKTPVKARISLKRNGDEETFSLFNELSRGRQNGVSTDAGGNWKFKELPKGTYKIIVEPTDSENYYPTYAGSNSNVSNVATNVSRNIAPKPKLVKKTQEIVIDDKDQTEMIIEIGYGATVSGTAVVENSEEMPKSVTILAVGNNDENTVTASIGNYADYESANPLKINHEFKLESISEGKNYFNVLIDDTDYYVKSATLNGTDLLGGTIEVKEGDVLRNVQIVLAKNVGTLKGVVLNDEKEPVKGLPFLIVPTDPMKRKNATYYRNATTNETGAFEIKAAPGEYAVIFNAESVAEKSREEIEKWLDEAIKAAQTARIEADKTETITVKKKK
jgi:hypothetical protein